MRNALIIISLFAALTAFSVIEMEHVASADVTYQVCNYYHRWCSNQGGVTECHTQTCSDSSCQDGNTNTVNTCAVQYCYSACIGHVYGKGTGCIYRTICSSSPVGTTSGTAFCTSSSCGSGTADCNNNPSDSCETNTNTNSNNCGACGNVCTGGKVCQNGVCKVPTDFSITVDPSSGIANKGDSKTANVTINLTSGTALSTTFSATGLPTGTTASFSPVSCSPNCYSNMTITTTSSTPAGSSLITVKGDASGVTHNATYNLTVISDSCNFNNVCEYPETQKTCGPSVANDCKTTATMSSPVSPGDIATVSVEFFDSRYTANEKVKIDLNIDGVTPWTSANGCYFGGVKLGPSASADGTVAWPSGTTSDAGHFKITTSCQVPSTITAGAHTLVATPTII